MKFKDALARDGAYLLQSNQPGWSVQGFWETYVQLTVVEHAFRVLKSELLLRPVWHHYSGRTQAHVLVCVLAYALWKTLDHLAKQAGLETEIRKPDRRRPNSSPRPRPMTPEGHLAAVGGDPDRRHSPGDDRWQEAGPASGCSAQVRAGENSGCLEAEYPGAAESRPRNVVKTQPPHISISAGKRTTHPARCATSANTLATWWRDRGHYTPRIVEDLRAVISMAAAGILVILVWNHIVVLFPADSIDELISPRVHLGHLGVEHILAAVVGFYFGSRS